MVRYLLIFVLLLFALKGVSQKRPIVMNLISADERRFNYGYFFGYVNQDLRVETKTNTPAILVTGGKGFNIGIMGEMKITKYMVLRTEPGFFYAENTLLFPNFTEKRDSQRVLQATVVRAPILLKASAIRWNNIRPFVMGGFSLNANLSSKEESALDNTRQVFRMKELTSNYEIGVGVDFYTVYFKVALSVRGVFGMGNQFVPDRNPDSPWTGNIQHINAQSLLFNITFE